VTWQAVRVLGLSDDAARVAGDLKVGEQIVALGAHLLRDGEEVKVPRQDGANIAGSHP
jgi:hypothetical protein